MNRSSLRPQPVSGFADRKHLFAAVAATLALFSAAVAQPAGTLQTISEGTPALLTLEEAVERTLTANPDLGAARYALEAAAEERRAAVGLRLPQLTLTGAYAYLEKDIGVDLNRAKGSIDRLAGDLLSGGIVPPGLLPSIEALLRPIIESNWNLKVQDRSLGFLGGEATLPIWMGGRINAAVRAARIGEASAREELYRRRGVLITEVVERYYGLALALQVVEVRRQAVAGMQRHLDDARELERNGMIAASERLYVEVKASEAERALADAQLQVETIRSALAGTLGGDTAAGTPATAMFLLERLEPVGFFRELAERHNPLLGSVALKRQLAEEGVRLKRAEFLPQVVAMGGGSFYNYQVSGIVPRWAVGIGIRIKLFDGLQRERGYAAARRTVREVEELERAAATGIGVLIEQRYNELESSRYRFASLEQSLVFAEEYLRMKEIAFREGVAPSSDLIDAELNLAAVRAERLEAAYRFDLALARLLETAGAGECYTACLRRSDLRIVRFDR